ncbi:MAG: diacylglycerol kinase family lipid kinase [Clostridia bacterium]|nr:diacylglycerol kinase family lipid kinase [Clostridia bacterium]
MKHMILVNPVSGRHSGLKHGIVVQKLLKKYNIDSSIIVSEYPGHLTKLTKDITSKEKSRIYVIGGDGSLNEVICGLIGTNSELVIIPCGTGNDFVKSISKYRSLRKIVVNSINKEASKTDILKLNDNKYCINIVNSGFDAMVAKNVDKFRKFHFISGKMKYNISIFYTLIRNKNYKFKIRIDDQKIYKGNYTLAVIANGKYYGGGVKPCPDALVNDGILNTCIIDATSILTKIFLLPTYKKGNHLGLKQAHIDKAKKISLVSNHKFPVSIDGEVFYTNKLSAEVLKEAINVVHIF